eukprot:CAMPEP_0176496526 /NCGR_PEP_ID=MMETSP0200_2-20121128/11239_1 /TAXON_ID=947934 /ORGANISM="Chaetoceros sp., Strain GSL56" /LENGTH=405 /DNA_ID=CAMNT_0017894481 /DNA_START=141 /DNA_END=1358 /DNA_ORIENTATION=-
MAQTLPPQPPIPPPFSFHAPTVPHGLPPPVMPAPVPPMIPPPPAASSSITTYPPLPVPPPLAPPTSSFALPNEPARKKLDTGAEKKLKSFLVKKYRPEKTFRCIEAFQRYTKTHRMTDATFQQISPPNRGATASAPIMFCARIGGSDLSWGRGKTQDIAIDNACRAAFALVAAHGYTDFDCNEDCLTQEPFELYFAEPPLPPKGPWNGAAPVPPPPLPPPPPAGLVPPPPVPLPGDYGLGAGSRVGVGAGVTLIPQAKTMSHQLAVPTFVISNNNNNNNSNSKESSVGVSLSSTATTTATSAALKPPEALSGNVQTVGEVGGHDNRTVSMSLMKQQPSDVTAAKRAPYQSTIKGGQILLFDPTVPSVRNDGDDYDLSMEMKRASLLKYRNVVLESLKRQKMKTVY